MGARSESVRAASKAKSRADDAEGAVFSALAHPVRRRILDLLKDRPGLSVREVSDQFELTRIAVMKHLAVLEEAGLVRSTKTGRTRALFFNVVPIQEIYDRWTDQFSSFWASKLTRIKQRVEAKGGRDE